MLALSRAEGVVLALGGAVVLLVAGLVLFVRQRPGVRTQASARIPRAMRPGPSDADLETPLLLKLQGWGVVLVVFFVIWVPMTWIFEPSRNLGQQQALLADSIARGKAAVQLYSEDNQGGVGCVRCHGQGLVGSRIPNTLTTDPNDVQVTPNLTTVCGGPWTGHVLIYSLNDIRTTIEQGRNLMPSWSIRYAGALDDQQISDIIDYIVSIQDPTKVTFAHNVCTNPNAPAAAVKAFGPPPGPPTTNAVP